MKRAGQVTPRWTRREAMALLGSAALAGCASSSARAAKVVVVGGGFAGFTCARALKAAAPELSVTLVEPNRTYTACPFSNLVVAGRRTLEAQRFGYASAARLDINVVHERVSGIDAGARTVDVDTGTLTWDRLVLAPGISLHYDALPGYDERAATRMPHAWQAGAQTTLLARQLRAMPDGGTVVIAAPPNPYRCPPGPYERASLIAHYLKTQKPRSKLLILDPKDRFSKQALFQSAWRDLYGDLIEWQGLADGARVVSVNPLDMTLETDFDRIRADVANVIPPQRAGLVAIDSGIADSSGWCPVNAATFESTIAPGVHVIGDAAILNAMPKSAFAANAQAKLCALQIARSLAGADPLSTKLINTCYSLVAPDHGISVAGVYTPAGQRWNEVASAGGTSPLDAEPRIRALEAQYANHWFSTITSEVFG